jgi:hypothetical protein
MDLGMILLGRRHALRRGIWRACTFFIHARYGIALFALAQIAPKLLCGNYE